MDQVHLVYSNHRPETVPYATDLMRRYSVVYLEEPSHPDFKAMLKGDCEIETYVAQLDVEYPEFSRQSCHAFRELTRCGVRLIQVEPYIDRLLQVHELFASGRTPGDIPKNTPMMQVYLAEKRATKQLIEFYEASGEADFDNLLLTLKRFAQADAARFKLRDQMRADAILMQKTANGPVYVEAGTMHVWLYSYLKRRSRGKHRVFRRHLMAPVTRKLTGKDVLMGPGDLLTMKYVFDHPADTPWCDTLAARALIFNKIINKEEEVASEQPFPDMRDEWRTIQTVNLLDIPDCESLYGDVSHLGTKEAVERVVSYLIEHKIEHKKSVV